MAKILVDIDGVLSPFFVIPDQESGFSPLGSWILSLQHKQWLEELSHHADLVWATAWEHEAHRITDEWGLPEQDVIEFSTNSRNETWKLPDIRAYVDTLPLNERVIWIDDEQYDDAHLWAKERGNVLLVTTDGGFGWQEEDFARMKEFLTA